ncbi:EAL domain-containing protein [Ideonella sp. A 288]|uniref:EAL domain-containing protein n=1 Tax=Ideonella sp. A 288 TaxID=1962181 RepID=UPI000B4B999D|nr:EAL domain-containing protein [Ideonella sp. A 288]
MNLNLKGRILVIATVVMLCAIGAVITSTTREFTQAYESALQSRALAIGKGLQTQLERLLQFGIAIDDLSGFDEQCQQVIDTYPGIESAMVVVRDGRVLFHSRRAPLDSVGDPALVAAVAAGQERVVTTRAADAMRHFATVPVRDGQSERQGSVVVTIDGGEIATKLLLMLRSALGMGLLVLTGGVLLLYATLTAFVTRPLAGLIGTIVDLRQSPTDLGRRAPVTTHDELGQLGHAFNELMHDLQQTTVSRSELQGAMAQLRTTSDALFEQKERAEVTLNSIADAVITTDALDRVRYLNPVAEQLTGWCLDEAAGQPVTEVLKLVDAATDKPQAVGLGTPAGDAHAPSADLDLIRRDGQRIGVDHRAAPMHDPEGGLSGIVLTFRDVSAARDDAQRRSWEASHDVLTGLANRREFNRRLEAALGNSRHSDTMHTVCFMDLDRFKLINDTCGHAAGDELLKGLTALLRDKVRQTDTLARLGGDEFALLLDGCSLDRAKLIAADLLAAVRDYRFEHKGRTHSVGISIGLAVLHAQSNPAEVLSKADTACYWAKEQGRDRACVFNDGDGDMAARRRETGWVTRIESALADDRFVLYHQSYRALKPSLGSRTHIEVLLRMVDEEGGLVQPGSFLPAAERYNLMPTIDRWVIRKVFAGYRELVEQHGGDGLTCAINLSGTSLNADGLIDFIREQAQANALPPQAICFELTETAAIHNLKAAAAFIRQCKAMGFQFALDDFGTGTSSFGYLKSLPVDYLKIDGGFVKNIEHDRIDRAMTETINHVGHILGIRTVAEYAENEAIIGHLCRIGVDYAQGYGVNRPSPLFVSRAVEAA